jgi:hypothetical protein
MLCSMFESFDDLRSTTKQSRTVELSFVSSRCARARPCHHVPITMTFDDVNACWTVIVSLKRLEHRTRIVYHETLCTGELG